VQREENFLPYFKQFKTSKMKKQVKMWIEVQSTPTRTNYMLVTETKTKQGNCTSLEVDETRLSKPLARKLMGGFKAISIAMEMLNGTLTRVVKYS